MLKAILGQVDDLVGENSIIWECTNCFNCYERCPQDVRPVEVIMALKNLSAQKQTNPEKVRNLVEAITKSGRTVSLTPAAQRIRQELGLEPVKDVPVDELKKILQ
jgi:heterodisulfide reductase subunit C